MFELSTSSTTTTVTVSGDLDLAERTGFPGVTARLAGLRPAQVVIDLCATTYLDSTGAVFLRSLGELVRWRGGRAVLQGASERDLYVLEVCGALEPFAVDRDHCCAAAPTGGPWRRGLPAEHTGLRGGTTEPGTGT